MSFTTSTHALVTGRSGGSIPHTLDQYMTQGVDSAPATPTRSAPDTREVIPIEPFVPPIKCPNDHAASKKQRTIDGYLSVGSTSSSSSNTTSNFTSPEGRPAHPHSPQRSPLEHLRRPLEARVVELESQVADNVLHMSDNLGSIQDLER